MNGRFKPMFGGFRHFLRPARPSCRCSRASPLIGGLQRSWLDVALYAANQLFLLRALSRPRSRPTLLLPTSC